jgi:hypothetical protein
VLNKAQSIQSVSKIAFESYWMYRLTGSDPAKSAITLPVVKITLHPRPGFKLYTDAEKPLSLFRTPIEATSVLHKDLFVTILLLPELNLIFQTTQKPTHFAALTVFIIHAMQHSPSLEASGVPREGFGVFKLPPPKFRRPSKIVPNSTRFEKTVKNC